MKFYVKEKLISFRDSFKVYGEDQKTLIYEMKGRFFSIRDRHVMYDTDGNIIMRMKRKFLSPFKRRFYFYDADDVLIAHSYKKFFSLRPFYTIEADVDNEVYYIEGSLRQRNFVIKTESKVCASVSKKMLSLRDSYCVDINDGENTLLVIAIVAMIDQNHHDGNN